MNQDSDKGKGIQKLEDYVMRFHKLRPSSEKTSSSNKLGAFLDFPPLSYSQSINYPSQNSNLKSNTQNFQSQNFEIHKYITKPHKEHLLLTRFRETPQIPDLSNLLILFLQKPKVL